MKKVNLCRIILGVLLTAACAGVICWIFSNSMQDAESSSSHSQTVTEEIQSAIGAIAPSSPVANATGEDFRRLHAFIRKCAHFSEFALLGGVMLGCCLVYTRLKRFLFVPVCAAFVVATFDEYIQNFYTGRGAAFTDICIDTAGAAAGMLLAGLTILLVRAIVRAVRKKRAAKKRTAA